MGREELRVRVYKKMQVNWAGNLALKPPIKLSVGTVQTAGALLIFYYLFSDTYFQNDNIYLSILLEIL